MANPTRDQLISALRKADAAGDTTAAQAIARRIKSMEQPAPPQGGIGRDLGLSARTVVEGVGDLVGLLGNPVIEGINKLGEKAPTLQSQITGQPERRFQRQMTISEGARYLADQIGLPSPETASERVYSDVGRALTGSALTLGGGSAASALPGLVGRVGRQFAANPVLQGVSAATGSGAAGLTREAGGSQGAQIAAGLAGGLLPAVGPSAAAAATRGTLRGGEQGRRTLAQSVQQFERAGTSPTLGQSGVKRAQYVEAGLRNVPGGASVVRRRLDQQGEELGQRVEDVASRLSPAAGAEKGGRAVIRGITGPSGFMSRFKQESAKLYDDVQKQLPPTTPAATGRTQAVLTDLTAPIPGAENTSLILMNPKVANIAQAFERDVAGGALTYDALKRLRSQVGELIGDTGLTVDTPTRQLRALYGAISDDLTETALSTGNPQAINAARRANAYYRAGSQRIDDIERVVDKSGGPEAVYRALFSGSREGGTTLRRVLSSLDGQSQRDVAAVTLRRLGRASPGAQDELGEVFSPETFLTNWNRIAPEAKRALFDRFGSGFRDDLDTIAGAASKARDAAQILPNPSGTAPAAAQATAYGTIALSLLRGDPATAAAVGGGIGAANALARVFTSPKSVKWLAQQTRLPPSALPAQLPALAQLAKTDEGAADLYRQITQTGQPAGEPRTR